MEIVLASASPRRRQLLRDLGIKNFTVMPSASEAAPSQTLPPEEDMARIAMLKAEDVSARCIGGPLVIAADTLVFLDGVPMGKPSDTKDAERMLGLLSGREHKVTTGIAVICGERRVSCAETTSVRFRPISGEEIKWYISTGEPMDKAGAYGIQGKGSVFIEGIDGDFYNVMGLPVCRLITVLYSMGFTMDDLGMAAEGG